MSKPEQKLSDKLVKRQEKMYTANLRFDFSPYSQPADNLEALSPLS